MHFHKRSDLDGSGKCTISKGSSGVHFAVYEIPRSEKPRLDAIEGLGKGYDELVLRLPLFGECQTYIAEDHAIDESLVPMDWYRELVLMGCRANGFPDDYVRRVEATRSVIDPDVSRRREHWRLVESIKNEEEG